MWTPVPTADGSVTLRCPRTGALMHSAEGAWTEALERYARPTRLASRAGPVRLLDIGTGLGWNLAAALAEQPHLVVVSLERDPGPIEATLALAERGGLAPGDRGELAGRHAPVARSLGAALQRPGEWTALGEGRLQLLLGDGRATLPALDEACRFDAVFLDPFAPGEDPPLWAAEFLAEVARRMDPGALLSTYTASLTVRVRLAAAGLRVGPGPRVGAKAQGTLASPDLELPALDARTERKLARRLDRGPFRER